MREEDKYAEEALIRTQRETFEALNHWRYILELLKKGAINVYLVERMLEKSSFQPKKAVIMGLPEVEWDDDTKKMKDEIAKVRWEIRDEMSKLQISSKLQNRLPSQIKQTTDAQSLNPEPQQENPKPTRGRGRPKETFKDKMIDDADGSKLQKIHTKIDGKKGKDATLIILACIKKGWLTKPTYTQVKNEFGDIGSNTGYCQYLNENKFTKEELEGAINSLD